jgi:xanthine dehydrogenase YagT iron-sulfur-binding subunit
MPALEVGAPAPEFSFADEHGTVHALEEFRGHPLIVAFPRDGGRQPAIQHLAFEGEALAVIIPSDAAVAHQFGVTRPPAVFVVNSAGAIGWRHAGEDGPSIPVPDETAFGVGRRDVLAAMLAASLAASAFSSADAATALGAPARRHTVEVTFRVNGRQTRLLLDPRVTLLDALRERLFLTGTKKGCDHGQCGACTVHVEGRRVLACLTLAASVQGKAVSTIEGLATNGRLHPIQQAFIDHDGFQCGYCTSGQIMSAVALLGESCGPSDDDVREGMSGNICRCGAYGGIVAAVQSVRGAGN